MALNELAQTWVAELRSGKYKQGQNVLRSEDNEYCCLGVLCELIDPNSWGELYSTYWERDDPEGFHCGETVGFQSALGSPREQTAFPNDEVLTLAGITKDLAQRLARENDHGYSFEEIAKEIEALA